MKRKKKQTKILILTALLFVITIGFAALAAQLKIDGTVNVSKTSWNVHFENVDITPGSVTASTVPVTDDVNKNTTEITYAISFTKPGDFYEFTVDMVNSGTIDAMIDTLVNGLFEVDGETTKTLPDYLESYIKYNDGVSIEQYQYLKANTSEKIKVRVAFRTDINPSDLPTTSSESMKLILKANFKQADNNAFDRQKLISLPSGKTKDNLQLGDEICINGTTTECFNFIKYEGTNNEDVVLLSKWNLNVGNNAKGIETNLQDSDVRGWVLSGTKYGNVAFSASNYWLEDNTLKPKYGTSFPADVYDPSINSAPDFSNLGYATPNYSIAYYVERYKTILTGYGAIIKNARLLKYSEWKDSNIDWGSTTIHKNTSYWLESAGSNNNVNALAFIDSDGETGWNVYNHSEIRGVRPVIVISKSNL